MERDKMIYPLVNASVWADRYKIDTPHAVCQSCKEEQRFEIPFAFRKFRGLLSSHGDCGEEFRQSVFVTTNRKLRKELGEFFTRFSEGK